MANNFAGAIAKFFEGTMAAGPDILMIGAYPDWDMEALARDYRVHRLWEAADKTALIAQAAPAIRAVATRGDLGADAELIAALPKLEIIGCFGVGVDGIDLAAAKARGIKVTNTPDVLTGDVADLAIGLMIAAARLFPKGDRFVRDGKWRDGAPWPLASRVFGKRLGIVGMGRIGQAIAKRAAAFDMDIAYSGRSKREGLPYTFFDNPVDLAARSDVLVASLAGGAATKGLIGADAFKALGSEGIFVNVARGSVADEAALLAALETKTIKSAGLDVYLNEPDIDPRFFALENAVLLPHVGSGTTETRKAMGKLVRDNLAAHFAGKPLLTEVV
jgi:lactate dehydrogenase-like 2-hydroxyacid dehydrogenase